MIELSGSQARRIALHAQRLGRRPAASPNLGHVRRTLASLGAVQIDAVNVLVRSHYLPIFSRVGGYPTELMDRLAYRRRAAFEYWGHAASILPVELHPAVRWRMASNDQREDWLAVQRRIERERPGYVDILLKEIAERGPLAYPDLADPARREKAPTKYAESSLLWYRWSDGKTVLEGLWGAGRLAVAGRRGFERLYDLPERVIPADILALPTLDAEDGQRALVRHAAAALGVGTVRDIADYFRLPIAVAKARLRELVDAGELHAARVQDWTEAVYLHPAARDAPVAARALLSPFDSLIWERARTRRLFGFRHSFELYVPAAKREYGYYVLPFLLGESLVARVDLKADRSAGMLLVLGAFAEPGHPPGGTAPALAAELRTLAHWLGLDAITVSGNGDLSAALAAELRG